MPSAPVAPSRYIRWPEIHKIAPGLTQTQWYSMLSRWVIPGIKKSPDGYGFLVPRQTFLDWLQQNPRFKEAPATPSPLANPSNDAISLKREDHENPQSRTTSSTEA